MSTRTTLLSLVGLVVLGAGCEEGTNMPFTRDTPSGGRMDTGVNEEMDSSIEWDTGIGPEFDVPNPTDFDGTVEYDVPTLLRDVTGCEVASCASPRPPGCVAAEICNDGLDNNCNMQVDENCTCLPGAVQRCFPGPPGRRAQGVCVDGMQRCQGSGEFGNWGPCTGGIAPSGETCDGADNDCNGCPDDGLCCNPGGTCPSPGDPRIPTGGPFALYTVRGGDFISGGTRYDWHVEGGPCDNVMFATTRTLSYVLNNPVARVGTTKDVTGPNLLFYPTLSGDYVVTLTVTRADGTRFICRFVIPIRGPGLRVEMCYPESTTQDADLFLHEPGNNEMWYPAPASVRRPSAHACGWHNCEGNIRGTMMNGSPYLRPNWGYMNSNISECRNGPLGAQWVLLGYCGNPRLDLDNNLQEGIGVPENINIDRPGNNQRFRIMVHNWSGPITHPLINVYCQGQLISTFGQPPDAVANFTAPRANDGVIGAMWRVADVTTMVDGMGNTTCTVSALHPPGMAGGHWVTVNDPQY